MVGLFVAKSSAINAFNEDALETCWTKYSWCKFCKYFGIDKVEESIRHRQKKFAKRYSGYSNPLCHLIFARLWCVKLLILYYYLFICVCILLSLFYFLCYRVMVNKMWTKLAPRTNKIYKMRAHWQVWRSCLTTGSETCVEWIRPRRIGKFNRFHALLVERSTM